jgi:hypothetical protein
VAVPKCVVKVLSVNPDPITPVAANRSPDRLVRLVALGPLFAALVMGAASHFHGLLLGHSGGVWSALFRSEYGRVSCDLNLSDPGTASKFRLETWPLEPAWSSPYLGGWWQNLGFAYGIGGTAHGNIVRQVTVPYWFLAVLAATLAAVLWRNRRSDRLSQSRCDSDWRQRGERSRGDAPAA